MEQLDCAMSITDLELVLPNRVFEISYLMERGVKVDLEVADEEGLYSKKLSLVRDDEKFVRLHISLGSFTLVDNRLCFFARDIKAASEDQVKSTSVNFVLIESELASNQLQVQPKRRKGRPRRDELSSLRTTCATQNSLASTCDLSHEPSGYGSSTAADGPGYFTCQPDCSTGCQHSISTCSCKHLLGKRQAPAGCVASIAAEAYLCRLENGKRKSSKLQGPVVSSRRGETTVGGTERACIEKEMADDEEGDEEIAAAEPGAAGGTAAFCKCTECGREFGRKQLLREHRRRQHPASRQRVACHLCSASFKLKEYLTEHIRYTHNKTYSWECDVCHKMLSSPKNLRRHKRLHGTAVHHCAVCGKGFHEAGNLRRHVLFVHNAKEVERLRCLHCDRDFSTKNNLTQHINSVHMKTSPYYCDVCKKYFGRKRALLDHAALVHPGCTPVLSTKEAVQPGGTAVALNVLCVASVAPQLVPTAETMAVESAASSSGGGGNSIGALPDEVESYRCCC